MSSIHRPANMGTSVAGSLTAPYAEVYVYVISKIPLLATVLESDRPHRSNGGFTVDLGDYDMSVAPAGPLITISVGSVMRVTQA